MRKTRNIAADLIADGYPIVGVLAPLASLIFTALKAADLDWVLRDTLRGMSYAWALLPLLVWVTIAYVRRHIAFQKIADDQRPAINTKIGALKLTLNDDPKSAETVQSGDGVTRVVRVLMSNDGDGFLSNCRAHIVALSPQKLGSSRLLGDGSATLLRGEKRWLEVAYQHHACPNTIFICGPVLPGFGGGILEIPDGEHLLTVRATAEECKPAELSVRIFLNADDQLRIAAA